jgi:hypothetical protein
MARLEREHLEALGLGGRAVTVQPADECGCRLAIQPDWAGDHDSRLIAVPRGGKNDRLSGGNGIQGRTNNEVIDRQRGCRIRRFSDEWLAPDKHYADIGEPEIFGRTLRPVEYIGWLRGGNSGRALRHNCQQL